MPIKKPSSKKVCAKSDDFILLDRSGSMGSKWAETLGAINGYVKKLADDGAAGKITVATFDSMEELKFEIIRDGVSIKKWEDLTDKDASPRGVTPLFDAIARIVSLAEGGAAKKSVLIVVTDGHENASKEVTKEGAKAALDRFKARGWQVVFLGADFDAFGQAGSVGVSASSTLTTSGGNYGAAMNSLATMRTSYAAFGTSMKFSEDDRAKAVGKKK